MNFKIIVGPANSGKSRRLCREIVQAASEAPDENFIAIVPEQFTLQMQRRVVEISESHAVMNIDIVSFNRLALKVFNELGINLNEVLDDTGKALVLRKVLEDCAPELVLFRKKIHMEGFIDEMKSVITELKTYRISDEDLEKAEIRAKEKNPLLSKKLKDIRLIYKHFNEEISDIYTTSEEVPDLFAKALYRSGSIKNANIYLDGFTGFTPVQYKIIEGFLCVCKNVTCSVTAPAESITGTCPETSLFYMADETYRRLVDLASAVNVKTETVIYEPVSEQYREDDLVNGPSGNRAERFEYEARNRKEEVSFVVCETARLVREENFRYREIAVVTTDMEGYYPYLEKAFRQADIPAFIDYKARIGSNRLAKFVLAALRTVKERFSYDSVFSYLKCGLAGLSADETARLENYCLEFGIKGPVVWSRDFEKNRSLHGSTEKAWNLEEINALRKKVMASLSGFAAKARRAETAAEYKEAFDRLFEANETERRLEEISAQLKEAGRLRNAEEYEQIFGIINGLFEKVQVLTKDSPVALDDYMAIIRNGIREIKIGLIPPTLDMVTAGDLERSRLNKIKALFVLGANEGSLPKTPAGGGILSAHDREFLKEAELVMAPSAMENFYTQRYYLYLMLNKPKKYLYLCRPALGEGGEALSRSAVFDGLGEYVPGAERSPEKIVKNNKDNFYYDEAAALSALAAQIRSYAGGADKSVIDKALLGYFSGKDAALTGRLIESAFYSNEERALDADIAKALYGETLKGSVSRFESFNECAFRHFLSYGLGLEVRPEYEIKAASLGSIYHSALEKYVNSVKAAGTDLRMISDEESRQLARKAAQEAISQEESRVFESSARNLYQAQRTIEVTVKTTDIIRKKIKEGKYDVEAVETRFNSTLEGGAAFSGIIDRIDIYDNGSDIYVNIVDYKTGSRKIDLSGAADGIFLQLPAYLKCAVEMLKRKYPDKNIRPSGIYYFLVRDEFEKEDDKDKSDAHLKGLCEDEERMNSLMDYTERKLIETAGAIKAGEASPSPLKAKGKIRVCEYCDFKAVCRFKEGEFGAHSRAAKDLDKDALEEEIYG